MALDGIEKARRAIAAAEEKQASDIVLLDLRAACPFADYFVICSAESHPQLEAIQNEIESALGREGIKPLHLEGTGDSGWLLMDFGELVVHLFDQEQRQYYALDRHWSQAVPLLRIQ